MRIGLEIEGMFEQESGWTLDDLKTVAARADNANVDFLIIPDATEESSIAGAWPDATITIGWLASLTQTIGLIAATATGGHQPYNLARRFASLDLISRGRVGWCVSIGKADMGTAPECLNEFVQVVVGLWQGWDADALLLDKKAGRFLDPTKMHTLNHKGKFFSVKGPLNVMRSPQDRPLLMFRAHDIAGQEEASLFADFIILDAPRAAYSKIAPEVRILQVSDTPPTSSSEAHPHGYVKKVRSAQDALKYLDELPARTSGSEKATLRMRMEGNAR